MKKIKFSFVQYVKIFFGMLVVIGVLLFIQAILAFEISKYTTKEDRENIKDLQERATYLEEYIKHIQPDSLFNKDWFLFKLALIQVESGLNHKALNPNTGAAGLYQIMPVYINEANRVGKGILFTDSCKWDIARSNLMFETVNAHHNPSKNIYRTIRGHNPGAGDWYKDKVLHWYNRFKIISEQL